MIVEFNTRPVKLVHYRSSCLNFLEPNISQPGFTCSKSKMETLEQCAKSVQI